jgi:hypothetical protein
VNHKERAAPALLRWCVAFPGRATRDHPTGDGNSVASISSK